MTREQDLLEEAEDSLEIKGSEKIDSKKIEEDDAYIEAYTRENSKEGTEVKEDNSGDIWFYADGKAGEGPCPEWFNSKKYKTVEEQAKAQRELEKKFGGFKGAPKEYEYGIPDLPDVELRKDDPMLQKFEKLARDSNMSQEMFTNVLKTYIETVAFGRADPKVELEKLGPQGAQRISVFKQWAENNFSEQEMKVLDSMIVDSNQFTVMEKLRRMMQENKIGIKTKSEKRLDDKKLLMQVQDSRFATDPVYRAEVYKNLERSSD